MCNGSLPSIGVTGLWRGPGGNGTAAGGGASSGSQGASAPGGSGGARSSGPRGMGPSTLLTGVNGIDNSNLKLGKNSLLGA